MSQQIPSFNTKEVRFTKTAMEALQEAAEDYIVGVFADTQLCAIHTKRITIQKKDMEFALRMRQAGEARHAARAATSHGRRR